MRHHLLSLLGTFCLLVGLGSGQNAAAATTTLTFDEFPHLTVLATQYQSLGVTVSGATAFNAVFSPWPAHSAPNIAVAPTGLMTFTLDPTIIGNIQTVSAYVSNSANAGLFAYDASNNLVGQALLTSGALPNTLLTVSSSGNPIASVTIHDRGTNFGVDDVSFATPATLPFATFKPYLAVALGTKPNTDSLGFGATLTLGTNGSAFSPATDVVTLQVGPTTIPAITIPAGGFKPNGFGGFFFNGMLGSVSLVADIQPQGGGKYLVAVGAARDSLIGITNPVTVALTLGNNTGSAAVTAFITKPKSPSSTPPQPLQPGSTLASPFGG